MYVYIDDKVKINFQGQDRVKGKRSFTKVNLRSKCHLKGQRSLSCRVHLKVKGHFKVKC